MLPVSTIGNTLGIIDKRPYLTDLNSAMKKRVITPSAIRKDRAIPSEIYVSCTVYRAIVPVITA